MASFLYTGNYERVYDIENEGIVSIYSENIEYTFPLPVNIKSYAIEFMEDSFPAAWYLMGKTVKGNWRILDSVSFVGDDGFTLSTNFDRTGYKKTFDSIYRTDSVMLVIDKSTETSIKIKQFLVYDELGINRQFLIPFCTSTNSLYHSGSLNFSQIDKFSIDSDLPTDFFAVNHNFLVIENGMADVMYR